jgi:hypothetical protein
MVLLDAAGLVVFLGFSPWAPQTCLGFLLPLVGCALEGDDPDAGRGGIQSLSKASQLGQARASELSPTKDLT